LLANEWGSLEGIAVVATLYIYISTFMQEQFDYLLIAFRWGSLERVAVVATLCINICSFVNKFSYGYYEPIKVSIVEPGTLRGLGFLV
jgi:hypothetical protein